MAPNRIFCLLLLTFVGTIGQPVVTFASPSPRCPLHFFDCGPEDSCIASSFVCDQEPDCENGSDELDCHIESQHFTWISCQPDQFRCNGTSVCLPNRWRCDGHQDCKFGDDERNCGQIDCDGFRCADGKQCVSKKYRCDGLTDCDDRSDELNCTAPLANTLIRESRRCFADRGMFECASGLCLSHEQVCDDHAHCPSGDDETGSCATNRRICSAALSNRTCSHGCMATPHGVQCFCPSGFRMLNDRKTCVDVDECDLELHHCHQTCVNTPGSYRCKCSAGYRLGSDNFSCVADTSEPLLLFADGQSIRGRWLRSRRYFEVIGNRKQSMGVDMHMQYQRVYWTQVEVNKPAVYSINIGQSEPQLLLSAGLHTPEDVAIDWIGENLYLTDAGIRRIIVCTLNALYCRTLFDDLDSPRSIVLWPANATVFWTDWGDKPGVFAGSMDGSKRWPLITRDIVWPNGLAFDEPMQRLYWADAKLERIECFDLVSGRREVVLDDGEFHPFSLDVFEGNMYWSDWLHFTLDSASKFTGRNVSTLVKERSHVFGIRVMHPVRQPRFNHECFSASCSHLCLLGPANRAVCACPDHMHLADDRITCLDDDHQEAIVFATDNQVFRLHPNAIGKDKLVLLSADLLPNSMFSIDDFSYDSRGHMLYVHEKTRRIIYQFDLQSQRWNTVRTNVSDVHHLTYDPFSANLIWIDQSQKSLLMSSSDGLHLRMLLNNLDQCSAFTLYPEQDQLFVAHVQNSIEVISRADTLGRNLTTVLRHVGQVTSMSVCRHTQRLYWTDSLRGQIRSVSLLNMTDNQLVAQNVRQIQSMAVNDKKVFWFDLESDMLHFGQDTSEHTLSGSIRIEELGSAYSPAKRRLQLLPTYPVPDTCVRNELNCSFLCSFAGFQPSITHPQVSLPAARCACPDGSATDEVNTHGHCERRLSCAPGLFHCRSDDQCIRLSNVCDGQRHCAGGEDEAFCDTTGCLRFESHCDATNPHSPCISNSWFCDGDPDCPNGEDEHNCPGKVSANHTTNRLPMVRAVNGTCAGGAFMCDRDSCLPWNRVCDQHSDCLDGSDEHDECLQKCACKNNGRCYQSANSTWMCHCLPTFTGNHCEHASNHASVTSTTKSIILNQSSVIKTSNISKTSVTSKINQLEDGESLSGQKITLIVIIVLLACFLILAALVYYLET